jgi:hypothetical protein
VWWCIPVISAFRRLRQEDLEFECPGLHSETLSQENKQNKRNPNLLSISDK